MRNLSSNHFFVLLFVACVGVLNACGRDEPSKAVAGQGAGDSEVQALIQKLDSADETDEVKSASTRLLEMGRRAIPDLARTIVSEPYVHRRPRGSPPIFHMKRDRSIAIVSKMERELRREAVRAIFAEKNSYQPSPIKGNALEVNLMSYLGQIGSDAPEAFEFLLPRVQDENGACGNRSVCISSLDSISMRCGASERTIDVLIRILDSRKGSEPDCGHSQALLTLGNMGAAAQRALPVVDRLAAGDSNADIRARAAWAADRIRASH